jgi:hypothetical protein
MKVKWPLKNKARGIVQTAIANGSLLRQPCEKCGSLNAEAHHEDYSKPLDVVWLCSVHHALRHRELKAQGVSP